MATPVLAVGSSEVNHQHERQVIGRGWRLARHYSMRLSKSRKRLSIRNFGGYRIDHCQNRGGFSLQPQRR